MTIFPDVSHHNGTVDWRIVAGWTDRAVLKATEGGTFVDPMYEANRAAAAAAGIITHPYHYARPDLHTPEDEAAHYLTVAAESAVAARETPPGHQTPPPLAILDWEGKALGLPLDRQETWISRWAAAMPPTTTPMLYASLSTARRLHRPPGMLLWVARWIPADPPPPGAQEVPRRLGAAWWQYTSTAHRPGIAGVADLNVLLS